MRYFSWMFGSNCHSCPRSGSCPDHEKEACPGPAHAAVASCPPPRTRLGLETLEAREVFSVNPVVAENMLPGTPQSQWDIVGNGDPTLQGFATNMSVDQGQTVQFKITDTTLAPYKIDIYRMGYYGGLGARLIGTVPSSQTQRVNQAAPLYDPATGLVDAGNWLVSASWQVPASATSGIYFARLTREDNGGASHVHFVVRDDDGRSDIVFQTADTTWHAYNSWGGNSLYGGTTGAPAGRAYAVSYNRPFNTRTNTPHGRDFVFGPEFAQVRWMEANGYDVSYISGIDTERYGSELLEHRVFMSVGHDEYWSGPQRRNVEAARDAGVNLMFLSGNQMYWKVRWENSIDASGTAYRTMVCYKETNAAAKIDPSPEWTGTFRDPRFRAEGDRNLLAENAVSGLIFEVNRGPGGETGTPFNVPAEFANLRFWRDTSVAGLQPGQTAVLGDIVLGYEWDVDRDNGFRPAGLFQMSSTTQVVPEQLDDSYVNCPFGGVGPNPTGQCGSCGCTVRVGTSTHNLVTYRADSGALVFGAGTVQWSYGLDGVHDGPASVAVPAMQQATVNMFADMGVQPATLRPGLVYASMSTDLARPTSTITSPANGFVTNVGQAVTVTGTAADGGGGVVAGIEVSTDGGATWRRATGRTSWSYTWTPVIPGDYRILSRAADDSGNKELPGVGRTVRANAVATSRTGLVAEYGFNQSSGTTLTDSSGAGNSGAVSGAAWAAGKFGNALSFDGINDWVTVADANSLDLTGAMTFEAWVRPTAPAADYSTILMKERGGVGQAYSLYAADGASRPPAAYLREAASQQEPHVTAANLLALNTWSHVAAVSTGTTLTLYVNGVAVGTVPVNGANATSSDPLRIGGNDIFGEFFQGQIDELRVYNRALGHSEILSDMSHPVGGVLDTTAPSVSASSSATNPVSGSVTFSATAADATFVGGVTFLVNGVPVGPEDATGPFSTSWDSRTVANGTYTLTARARDAVGNATTSAGVTLVVNNAPDATAPTVRLTYPEAGQPVGGPTVLSAVAADNLKVAGVQFRVNGANVGAEVTAAPYRVLWNTAGLADGTYTITAVARDATGNLTTSAPVAVVVDGSPPAVTSTAPASGATGVFVGTAVSAVFNDDVVGSSISFTLRDPNGNVVSGATAYDPATRTARFTPAGDLLIGTAYTATVSGARDATGNMMAAPHAWTFTTDSVVSNATIFPASATPTTAQSSDTSAIEVGVRFQSNIDGYVTAIRLYRGGSSAGTLVANLWRADGTLMGFVPFTDPVATPGWRQVEFSAPIAVTAGTTYTASYHAPTGGYAVDANFFGSAVVSGQLTALANASGGNGVYRYGSGGAIPTSSFGASNYWVDVAFSNTISDTTAPTVTARSPAPGATGVGIGANVAATFSESVQSGTIAFQLRDAANALVPASVAYDPASRTVTLNPTANLANSATYTATLSGAKDLSGNTMASVTWSFTTGAPDTTAPTVTARSPAAGATGVPVTAKVTLTFSESIDFGALTFQLRDAANALVPAEVRYDDTTRTATLSPLGPGGPGTLLTSTAYTATVGGATDLAGNAMAPTTWSFTTAAPVLATSLWPSSATPAVASTGDTAAVELGVRFRSDIAGYVTGVRFYKGAGNTGTHVGHLWNAAGSPLASATFTNEAATGWQQVNFATPVAIAANTTYVASYYAPNGGYAQDTNYFAADTANGNLTAPSAGGNGVFRYGTGGGFPTQSYNASNYWVDVVFSNTLVDSTSPAVTARTPAPGATVLRTSKPSVTFSEAVQTATISFVVRDASNAAVPATIDYDPATRTATLTPTAGSLAAGMSYTAVVSGAQDPAGNTMAPVSWTFSTAAAVTGATLWAPSATPAVADSGDTSAVELGVRFRADVDGLVTGVRFYKGAGNTGTHVGRLWDASGNLLASATFVGETATGWQQVNFNTPVFVTAGTTYVASYYAPTGGYAVDAAYFNAPVAAGHLTAPSAGGNGVFRYGTGGGFPTQSYNASNYWVDAVFSDAQSDTTAPAVTARTPAPGATGLAIDTVVTVTFGEPVRSSTIVFQVRDAANNPVPGQVAYDGESRTATFQPTLSWAGLRTYTATVSGVQDLVGNAMTATSWSFTTQGAWRQTTAADFAAGAMSGVVAGGADGGALVLTPAFRDDFAGTTLAVDHLDVGSGRPVTVGGGAASVGGGVLQSAATYAGKAVEGRVSFGATPYQHFGLATGLDSVAGNAWAMFSTGGTTNQLYARVNAFGTTQEVSIGALPAGFHNYRVKPVAGGFEFAIDGAVVATIALAPPAGTGLRVVASDYNNTAPLSADWVAVADYAAGGTFTSAAYDAGAAATLQTAAWAASTPAGTGVAVEVAVSADGTTWSAWTAVTNGGAITGLSGRYLRYRVLFATTDPAATPEFGQIELTFA